MTVVDSGTESTALTRSTGIEELLTSMLVNGRMSWGSATLSTSTRE
jgi:hypothetical protein